MHTMAPAVLELRCMYIALDTDSSRRRAHGSDFNMQSRSMRHCKVTSTKARRQHSFHLVDCNTKGGQYVIFACSVVTGVKATSRSELKFT